MTTQEKERDEATKKLLLLQDSRPVSEFEKLNYVGEGTFGVVYRARDSKSNEIVALKRLRIVNKEECLQPTSLREIDILRACKHENIITLKEVLVGEKWGRTHIYLAMEFCERDLAAVVDSHREPLLESHAKCIAQQVLDGLTYLHSLDIVHRDIKLSNLLLTNGGCIKIGDFGLARYLNNSPLRMTPQVVTLWYRAPELLLGASEHTYAIDMWAFGCVYAELLERGPLWPGNTEISQLGLITALIGAPTIESWPGLEELPCSSTFSFTSQPENRLNDKFAKLSPDGIDLMLNLFRYDPEKRLTAEKCLRSLYFQSEPLPCDRLDLTKLAKPEDDLQPPTSDTLSTMHSKPLMLPAGVTSEDVAAFLHSLNKKPRLD